MQRALSRLVDSELVQVRRLGFENLYESLAGAEESLGRQIQPTLYSPKEFERRRDAGHHFVKRILKGEVIWLLGEEQ